MDDSRPGKAWCAMRSKHLLSWGGVLARFFSIQMLVQAATALTGIAIVRVLTKQNYAFYTIATSFMFSAAALTDCGISAALSALGGKVWEDGEALGSLIKSALSIRRWLAGLVVLGVGVSVPLMLRRDGASVPNALSITAVLITSLLFQFGVGLFAIVPQLRANYRLLERAAIVSTAARIGLLALAYVTVFNSATVLLANCAGYGVQLWLYRRFASREVNLQAKVDKKTVSAILVIIRKQVPYEIYGVLSGQISVFLITFFGDSARVADVGALGRLAMVFTAMSSVLSNVLLPRFARCQDPAKLRMLYVKIVTLYSLVVSSILPIGWLFPNQLVSILGHSYGELGGECLLAVSVSVSGAILGSIWGLNTSRGWIVPAWIGLTAGVSAQAVGILLFNIRSVHGVLLLGLLTNCTGLCVNLVASGFFLRSVERGLVRASR
jgi:O-antigen/teichoic acid export membrane protein